MSMPIDRSERSLLQSLSEVNLQKDMKEGDRLVIRNGRSFVIVKSTDTTSGDTKELYAIVNEIKNAKIGGLSGSNKQLISNLEVLNGKISSHNKKVGPFLTFLNSVCKFLSGKEIETYKQYETLQDKLNELRNSPKTVEDCLDDPNAHHPIQHLAELYPTNQILEPKQEEAIYRLMIQCPDNELDAGVALLDKLPSELRMRILAGILSQTETRTENQRKESPNAGLFNRYFSGLLDTKLDKFWNKRPDQTTSLSDNESRVFIHLLEQADSNTQKRGLSKLLSRHTQPFLEHYLKRSTNLLNAGLVRNLLLRIDDKQIESMNDDRKRVLREVLTPSPLFPTPSDFSVDSVKLFSLLVRQNLQLSQSEGNYIVQCAKEWPEHHNNDPLINLLRNLPMNLRAEILASAKETVFNEYYTPTRSFLSEQQLNRSQANLSLTSFECKVMKRLIGTGHADVQQGAQRYLQLVCSPSFQLEAKETTVPLLIQLLSTIEIDPKTKQPRLDVDTERQLKTHLPLLVSNSSSDLIPTCIALFEKLPTDTAMYVLSALSREKRAEILSATKPESRLIRNYYSPTGSSARSFFTDQKLTLSSMLTADQWKLLKQLLVSGNTAPLAEGLSKASKDECFEFFKSIRKALATDSLSPTQVLSTLLVFLPTFPVESKHHILVEEARDLLKTPESLPEHTTDAESLSLLSLYYSSQQTFMDELPKTGEEISAEKAKELKDIYRALVRLDKTTFGQEAILVELGARLKMPIREVEELGNILKIPLSVGVQVDSALETGKEVVGEFVDNTGKVVDETLEEARKKAEQAQQALSNASDSAQQAFDQISEEARKKAEEALNDATATAKKTLEELSNRFKGLFG